MAVPTEPLTLEPPRLSDLVISNATSGVKVSLSVALLIVSLVAAATVLAGMTPSRVALARIACGLEFPGLVSIAPAGGVTVAVFDKVPIAEGAMVAWSM